MKQKKKSKSKLWLLIKMTFVIIFLAVASILIQASTLGQWLIILYGIIAIAKRIESDTTFKLAVISLVGVPFILLYYNDQSLAENFALYSFLFLVIGTISAVREGSGESRTKRFLRQRGLRRSS
jgi:hypothetical protein